MLFTYKQLECKLQELTKILFIYSKLLLALLSRCWYVFFIAINVQYKCKNTLYQEIELRCYGTEEWKLSLYADLIIKDR